MIHVYLNKIPRYNLTYTTSVPKFKIRIIYLLNNNATEIMLDYQPMETVY